VMTCPSNFFNRGNRRITSIRRCCFANPSYLYRHSKQS
jgi:hypothetical protein